MQKSAVYILGIDPGLANTGWGLIEANGPNRRCLAYGCITTSANNPIDERLLKIHDGIKAVVERYHPTELGIEQVFFAANVRSAIATGHARGAALVAVASEGIKVGEYSPLQIKQAVVGTGTATKDQMTYMVRAVLKLDHDPKPDHAADALGAAICHANLRGYEMEVNGSSNGSTDRSGYGEAVAGALHEGIIEKKVLEEEAFEEAALEEASR